jgi:hypothetical protein
MALSRQYYPMLSSSFVAVAQQKAGIPLIAAEREKSDYFKKSDF